MFFHLLGNIEVHVCDNVNISLLYNYIKYVCITISLTRM